MKKLLSTIALCAAIATMNSCSKTKDEGDKTPRLASIEYIRYYNDDNGEPQEDQYLHTRYSFKYDKINRIDGVNLSLYKNVDDSEPLPLQIEYTIDYQTPGYITTSDDMDGNMMTFKLNDMGYIESIDDQKLWEYDAQGYLIKTVERDGDKAHSAYTWEDGNLISMDYINNSDVSKNIGAYTYTDYKNPLPINFTEFMVSIIGVLRSPVYTLPVAGNQSTHLVESVKSGDIFGDAENTITLTYDINKDGYPTAIDAILKQADEEFDVIMKFNIQYK